ncbi:unnamed protein product [marine sediment metagenome]|uniref:Uncharacterized protein n=1 Tax=marine sediment metagenome TaxID=412755 RepID=X1AWN6_9ZZZZ
MKLINLSDRKDIDRIILTNHLLMIKNEKGETEAHLLRVQDGGSVKARHRRMVMKMKEAG